MTRLQNKCLVASVCFHGLMVAGLLATAAFRSEPPAITGAQVLTLVPARILDAPGGGGGGPVPAPVPPPAPPAPPPVSTPAPPAPPVIRPVPAPVPPQRSPTPPKPIAAKPAPDPAPVTHKITPSYTPVAPSRSSSRSTDTPAQTRAAELAAAQAAAREAAGRRAQEAAVATALAGLDSSIRGREIPVTVAALPGDGGGEAFASYDTAVCTVYYNAWRPEDPARKVAAPVVKIVVSRNGNVTSSAFVSKSGDPLLDRSVQRALDAVKELPPFPPTSTDTERSFVITFNPEAKQSAG